MSAIDEIIRMIREDRKTDPRIAKLEAVARDAAATKSEKRTALALIRRLKAKKL